MSSGGGGSQTTTQSLPGYAQPYAQQILQQGATLSQQQMPQYTGQLAAGLTPGQQSGIDSINSMAGQSNPTLNAANSAAQGAISNANNPYQTSNQYIGQNVQASQNPYATMDNPDLDAQVNKAQTDLTNQYAAGTAASTMAQFRNSGAFGGSAQQETQQLNQNQLANALTNVDTQLRGNAYAGTQAAAGQQAALNTSTNLANQTNNLGYTQQQNALNSQNYQNAQNNALQGASLAPSLNQAGYYGADQQLQAGQTQQATNQNQLGAQYQQWYNQAYSPYQQLGVLQSALSGALGSGSQGVTQSTQSGGNGITGALGGAATGAAAGSVFGPWGTAIGAGAGLIGSYL
jgi:hypothetical protein